MTRSRMRCILVALPRCRSRTLLEEWYSEVFGAEPGVGITTERLRASLDEALREGLEA